MRNVEAEAVARLVGSWAARELGAQVDTTPLEIVLRGVLGPPRDLLAAAASGIVTRTEVAAGVAAHVHTWLIECGAVGSGDLPDAEQLVRQIEATLFPPS